MTFSLTFAVFHVQCHTQVWVMGHVTRRMRSDRYWDSST